MFKSARFKITIWYVLAIMLISLTFSFVIYRTISTDLNQRYANMENQIRNNVKDMEKIPPVLRALLQNDLKIAQQRVFFMLIFANGGIFIISLLVGYFLAGRTLKPIEEMVKEQNRFISDASHELRTPLAVLKTSTEVALRDKKMSAAEARHILEDNLDDIESLELLSEHLLHLSQYQKGRKILEFEKINIGESAKRIHKKVRAIANKNKINLKLETSDIYIRADRISIEELILILMDNAIKYTPEEGSVTLSISSEGRNAAIKVSDSGEGIGQKDMPYIFDRFYRADRSRSKNRISGFGLGLPVARRIVELHHGSMNVSSKPGSGSTFTIRFPLI